MKELEDRLSKSRLALAKPQLGTRRDGPQELSSGTNKTQPSQDENQKPAAQSEPTRVVHVTGLRDVKWWQYMLLVCEK